MAATFQKFNQFALDLTRKVHNLSTDSLKVLLTNVAPVAGNAVKGDLTEIAAGNGYAAGGVAVAVASLAQTGGVTKLVLNNPAPWVASGGTIGPFRYAVLYNNTPTSPAGPLIGFADYGTSVTLNDGEQFGINFDATNGVFTIT